MIKGINLIPEEIRQTWKKKRIRRGIVVFAVSYLIVLGLFYVLRLSAVSNIRQELVTLEADRAALEAGSSEYRTLTRTIVDSRKLSGELKRRLEAAADLITERISWYELLSSLSGNLPDDVWLRSLSSSDIKGTGTKRLKFLGSSLTSEALADFVFVLENSSEFTAVDLVITQSRQLGITTVYDFEIHATLKRRLRV